MLYILIGKKIERLQDFLSKLLDPSNDMPMNYMPFPPVMLRVHDLEERYKQALKIMEQQNEEDQALCLSYINSK